ncbi:MAG: nucleotidyltransferase family protein [Candidatus Omnitrophica bacterium]|nr:nucleotidyltransferase family protein [Candidatus Omnitrophota bacterium]
MKVLILAAGYATRLWPLTLNRPKPLLTIQNRPILEHIIQRLKTIDEIDEILVVTNTKFVKNFKEWKKKRKGKNKISVVDDGMKKVDDRRGAIGDIIFTIKKKKITSDLLVIAGDNIFDFDIDGFVRSAKEKYPFATIGVFDIKNKSLASKYGIVTLDKSSRILSFAEKPKKPKSTLAAMCLYYIPGERLKFFNKYKLEGNSLDLAGSFIKWLSGKEEVYGYIFRGRWLDIGDKRSLKRAENLKWGKEAKKK